MLVIGLGMMDKFNGIEIDIDKENVFWDIYLSRFFLWM